MKAAPCKDCEERYVGCHAKCERFQEWDKEKWEIKTKAYKAMKMDGMVSDVLRRDPLSPRGGRR